MFDLLCSHQLSHTHSDELHLPLRHVTISKFVGSAVLFDKLLVERRDPNHRRGTGHLPSIIHAHKFTHEILT